MEVERTGDHHAALTQNFPPGLANDASNLARHDPMRLPDVLLRRSDAIVGAVGRERDGFIRSSTEDGFGVERMEREKREAKDRENREAWERAEVEEMKKRAKGRPDVLVRRRLPALRQPRELLVPSRGSEQERTGRSSNGYNDMPRQASPPKARTYPSYPYSTAMPHSPPVDPRRAYPTQEPEDGKDFRPSTMRHDETMPNQSNIRLERGRESTRNAQKSSSLRRVENLDALPTPSTTPEPTIPRKYGIVYADNHETAVPNGYRTSVHNPSSAGSRKVTRSRSPLKAERPKEKRGMQSSRVVSYVYRSQGLQDVSANRPTLARNESEITITSRSSPRQTRTKYPPSMEDSHYPKFPRPNTDRVMTIERSNSPRAPLYGEIPTMRSSYDVRPRRTVNYHVDSKPFEKQIIPSAKLSHRQRFELVCQTVSRDETSSEDAKISSFVKTAMEPHVHNAQVSKISRPDTPSFKPPVNTSFTAGRHLETTL